MSAVGTLGNPLRVAVIGSGPAGFYTAEHLFKQPELSVEIDMFDRLPTPYGLVRAGVAPDHEKIKSVTRVFDRIAGNPSFRFHGYVEFGKDVSLTDLRQRYHQVVFATGAQTDRQLMIPGEDSLGCHGATEFVAWYNGHPDYRDCEFDLSLPRVAVVGVGNVAVDVARMLCRTVEELETTDIADHALEALRESKVEEVYLLGRRGPAQAAFTNPEVKELNNLADAEVHVVPEEVQLDPLSAALLEQSPDKQTRQKVEILQEMAAQGPREKSRRLFIRFLVSPVEIRADASGRVCAVELVRNELYERKPGVLGARPTDRLEELPADLLFRSVGYRGIPLPGVAFDNARGVIPNDKGRVIEPYTRRPVLGLYASGWIKRGPSGVIGTNKSDAAETVATMLEDLQRGEILAPAESDAFSAEKLVREKQPNRFSYTDWMRLNEIEVVRGQSQGRPRAKLSTIEEMLEALDREHVAASKKTILVPTDLSECADQALTHALCMARTYDASLHMVHVSMAADDAPQDPAQRFPSVEDVQQRFAKLGCGARPNLAGEELDFRQVRVRGASVDREILSYAEEHDVDLIVMGTHGRRGMDRRVIGSIAEKIVRLARCPVMTSLEQKKTKPLEKMDRILLPLDFSGYSRLALAHAKRLAADLGARLQLLHVVEEVIRPTFYYASESPPGLRLTPDLEARCRSAMQEIYDATPGPHVDYDCAVSEGHAATNIVEYARDHPIDLIIIPTHGLTGYEDLLLGNTTGRVVRRAPCPVFTVKAFGKFLF